ncbi:MAG: DUF4123 domain-containing protein [Phycisphaerae bacterium]
MTSTPRNRADQASRGNWSDRYGGLELFARPDVNVYAVLDGASVEGLLGRLGEHQPEYYCLYREELTADMAEVAPYVVALEAGTPFTDWVIENGWGKHWGIFALSKENGRAMRQHFRKFVMVESPEGEPLYFRFYDPRVLREFLPTCTAAELAELFGPVTSYVLEAEDPDIALRFEVDGGQLRRSESPRRS